jgi:Holliday junction resolvasome RuvABC DNA-binding subunit
VAALVSLGYKPADAQRAVAAAGKALGPAAPVEELVRAALRSA